MRWYSILRNPGPGRICLVLLTGIFLNFSRVVAGPAPLALSNQEELEAFMDGLMEAQMKAYHIAGASIAVVKDSSILLSKGYGYADLTSHTPVDPSRTLFRIGSISKLFVWTSVMQQVEQGTLNLDQDINTYLTDFRLPATFEEPIKMTHLMTHTAGFEDQVIGIFAKSPDRIQPLAKILPRELPVRVYPPGQITSYSNHGTAIAAYVVEQLTGQPWTEYLQQRILDPLKMQHTTFQQPVPLSMETALSRGYSYRDGMFIEKPFEYVPMAPVGGGSSTAEDMAKFMVAHLQLGRLGTERILQTNTVRRMQEPVFRATPAVNGMCYGFIEHNMNGQRVIGHGGDTILFHSLLALLPDDKVGLFLSFNSEGGSEAIQTTFEKFMHRYYPPDLQKTPAVATESPGRLRRFAGIYRSVRYSHSSLAKLAALFSTFRISITKDGALQVPLPEPTRWFPTTPLTFQEEYTLNTLAFQENSQGKITHLFLGDMPFVAFERIGWLDSPTFHLLLLSIAFILFAGVLIFYPTAAFIRRRCGVSHDPDEDIPIPATILLWFSCLFLVAFAIGLFLVLRNPMVIAFSVPLSLKILLILPFLALVGIIGPLAYIFVIWTTGRIGMGRRVYFTATTLMCVVVLGQLDYWNLLGFHF